jgi:hypothetical protein
VCALWLQDAETIDHLLLGCVYSRETWFNSLYQFGWHSVSPTGGQVSFADWWLQARKRVVKLRCKAFDSLTVVAVWHLKFHESAAVDANKASRCYCFGPSTVAVSHIREMTSLRYFAKGDARAPGEETVPEPTDDEAVVFEEIFAAGIWMPP